MRPDVLKLARAIEDAITGVIWVDDSQIIDEHLYKRWGDPARVEVTIEPASEVQSNLFAVPMEKSANILTTESLACFLLRQTRIGSRALLVDGYRRRDASEGLG
jgi:hypothetical protein